METCLQNAPSFITRQASGKGIGSMRFRPDHLWIGHLITSHFGPPASAIWVARAQSHTGALIAIRSFLAHHEFQADVALRGLYSDMPLDEAAQIGRALNNGQATIGEFGYDLARSLTEMAEFRTIPQKKRQKFDPEQLHNILFSQPRKDTCPCLCEHAYAVLDAAQVFGLPERLESTGLEYACLFDGKAAVDFAAAAPWIVRLVPDHPLTATLLNPISANALAWQQAPGLLLKAPLSVHGLRRQLRRFTMLYNNLNDSRVFFRFYDPMVFRSVVVNAPEKTRHDFACGITSIFCPDGDGNLVMLQRD